MLVGLGIPVGGAAAAQPDSVAYRLAELVVVAEGTAGALRESVTAATVLTRDDITEIPARTLPDLLRRVPGLIVLERDGAGEAPLVIARGFYGGGETEYVLVMVDGLPINDLRTGAVDWTRVRPWEVERIEVLRGGGAALYGDQAVGAVINVVTRPPNPDPGWTGTVATGSWGDLEVGGSGARPLAGGALEGSLSFSRSSGYRDHSDATVTSVGAGWRPLGPGPRRWALDARFVSRVDEDAGPLTTDEMAEDRRRANASFGADERDRRTLEITGRVVEARDDGGSWTAALAVQRTEQEQSRTIPLAPSFGDTQFHDESSLLGHGRAAIEGPLGPVRGSLGVEVGVGGYASAYARTDARDDPTTRVDGSRRQGALALALEWRPRRRLKVVAAGRYDAIRVAADPSSNAPTFRQFSPRLGANLAYALTPRGEGHLYANWGRAFKAPTLDQLFDGRRIPVGPDQSIGLSNAELRPQRSTDVEVGVYQALPLPSGRTGALSVAAYRIDLDDEIDFDLATFRYANIQRSEHSGIEASVDLPLTPSLVLRHSLTVGRATIGAGPFAGNQLPNVPLDAAVTSLHARPGPNAAATLSWRHTGRMYLDGANRRPVSDRDVVDVSASWSLGRTTLSATVRNLFDAAGEEGGFLLDDPVTGDSVALLYPAGGRYARISVRIE